jgi:hypothetical protein
LEDLRAADSAYLTACRQFVDYLKQPANKVDAVRSTSGDLEVPVLNSDGAALRQAVEAASADLLLLARSQAIVEQARLLRVAMLRVSTARAASADGIIPGPNLVAFRHAEQAYLNAVRTELGLPPIDVTLWANPSETRRYSEEDQPIQ